MITWSKKCVHFPSECKILFFPFLGVRIPFLLWPSSVKYIKWLAPWWIFIFCDAITRVSHLVSYVLVHLYVGWCSTISPHRVVYDVGSTHGTCALSVKPHGHTVLAEDVLTRQLDWVGELVLADSTTVVCLMHIIPASTAPVTLQTYSQLHQNTGVCWGVGGSGFLSCSNGHSHWIHFYAPPPFQVEFILTVSSIYSIWEELQFVFIAPPPLLQKINHMASVISCIIWHGDIVTFILDQNGILNFIKWQ